MATQVITQEFFVENFLNNTGKKINSWKNILNNAKKFILKLSSWETFEFKKINKKKFNPHWPEGDWTEVTEKNKIAYKEAMIDLEKWDVYWMDDLKKMMIKRWLKI